MPEGQAAPPAAAGAAGRQEDNGMRRIFNLVQVGSRVPYVARQLISCNISSQLY
jgi:hypothetical protein